MKLMMWQPLTIAFALFVDRRRDGQCAGSYVGPSKNLKLSITLKAEKAVKTDLGASLFTCFPAACASFSCVCTFCSVQLGKLQGNLCCPAFNTDGEKIL